MISRRTFFSGSGAAFAASIVPRSGFASNFEFQELPSSQDARMKMLIETAVDSAKSAGATYADARLTFDQFMMIKPGSTTLEGRGFPPYNRSENMAFGVRALVNGYWGFASSPVWSKEEAGRLGAAAVDAAKANLSAKQRHVEFAPNPNSTSGDWVMPVVDDPFDMDSEEISDFLDGLVFYLNHLHQEYRRPLGRCGSDIVTQYNRQQKAFGNTENQYVTQRLFRTGGFIRLIYDSSGTGGHTSSGELKCFNPSGHGAGFEVIRRPDLREHCHALFEELVEEAKLPLIPVDIGKFNCLFHPQLVAPIAKRTIGIATEIDRVMGFEANTTGTSYIKHPNEELGILKVGTKDLNVTATRSLPGGIMSAKWDDEGVSPNDFAIVKEGLISDLQSGREGASWMKEYKSRLGKPLASNGCVYAIDAVEPPAVHTSDLIVQPNQSQDKSLSQLREQMENGLELNGGMCHMDFQQASGLIGNYSAFQIRKGKRIARYISPGILFKTPELWNSIMSIGGGSTSLRVGTFDYKQNPVRISYSSVDAPAVLFKDLSIVDPSKKA